MSTILKKTHIFKIGKNPVAVLPINAWNAMRERLDILEEYYQMSVSTKYKKDIARARLSKKEISAKNLYKRLGLA